MSRADAVSLFYWGALFVLTVVFVKDVRSGGKFASRRAWFLICAGYALFQGQVISLDPANWGDASWVFRAAGLICLYGWWKNGGGDDTKRRLRKLRKKFQPTRRTAPQSA